MNDDYPSIKEILYALGMGSLLVGSILLPGLGLAAVQINRYQRRKDWEKSQNIWKKYNLRFLKRNINRLKEQKLVELIEEEGEDIVKLTEKGKAKFLKFKLEELSLKGKVWDKKWRVVLYDISSIKKDSQESFRRLLKYIRFLRLQKSVYLTPFPCEEQIEYLRQYFNIGSEVLLIRADKIENEEFYMQYFGI